MSKKILPSCSEIYTPLLCELYFKSKQACYTTEMYNALGNRFRLSNKQWNLKMRDGRNHWENRVQSAKGNLVSKGYVYNVSHGCWGITEEGKGYLLSILLLRFI
ncbi:winged helix-turn-helix domain-containing protein [Lysinibacillus sp. NPDC097231]|uniref:winged helix-turn-helix domain-containing protein n=1 Tax=Lysinibacillus sp. NPDC097231 TaxID=3364142 RepID=UPI0038248E2F